MSTCDRCGRQFEYDYAKGHRGTRCNSCVVNARRFAIKDRALAYKGGRCGRCGYDRNSAALQFHHRDPSRKDFQISGAHARRWSAIEAELEKCDLLCANCHIEAHHPEGKRPVA